MYFGFEELEVWRKAIDFADYVIHLTENIETNRRHFRLVEQLEAASASIAMNIAEGKGRYSKKEFIQFLYISRGSLYECITLLIIFQKTFMDFRTGIIEFGGQCQSDSLHARRLNKIHQKNPLNFHLLPSTFQL